MTNFSLDDLMRSEDRASFLDAFTAKRRWYQPIARAAQAQALLPWAMIEGLIANGLVPADRFRVAVNGHDVSPATYSDDRNRLRADTIQGFAAQGATLIVNDIGALVPAIGDLAITMERDLRCRVQINCYITCGAVSAFVPHHDVHDVLVLQIHGTKRWRGYGTRVAFPITGGRPPVDWDAEWEGLMAPGDLLYLPRGEIHAAVPETWPSVHLTIGITETTGVDFLQWLATKAKDIEALRRDLGTTLADEDRAARDQDLLVALRGLLDRVSIAEFFADQDMAQPLRPSVTLGSIGRFLPETQLVSALRRRRDLATGLEGENLLHFGNQKLRLSHLSCRVLTAITGCNVVTVADLAAGLNLDVGDRELAASLEDLVRKSLIAIVA